MRRRMARETPLTPCLLKPFINAMISDTVFPLRFSSQSQRWWLAFRSFMSLQLRYFHHHGEMMVSHLCSEVFEPKVVTERPSCILFNAFLHRSYSYKISPVMKTEIDQLNLEFGVLLKAIHFLAIVWKSTLHQKVVFRQQDHVLQNVLPFWKSRSLSLPHDFLGK